MSATQLSISPTQQTIFTETSLANIAEGIKAFSGTLFSIKIDNSANSGAASYVSLYFLPTSQITVGTTPANIVVYVPASAVIEQKFFTGSTQGVAFLTALSAAATTLSGGSVSPSSPVIVNVTLQ